MRGFSEKLPMSFSFADDTAKVFLNLEISKVSENSQLPLALHKNRALIFADSEEKFLETKCFSGVFCLFFLPTWWEVRDRHRPQETLYNPLSLSEVST